jgi:SAM-dependent methyltransferase
MPIIKCRTHLEVYQERACSSSLHELSGRGINPKLTEFISRGVLKKLPISHNSKLVDIGCGDGTLLAIASSMVESGVGILPSKIEVEKVAAALCSYHNLSIIKGLSSALPLNSECADVVVCNGVFILLDQNDVFKSLDEIARILKPGAFAFIGEIPKLDEMHDKTYGDSLLMWLYWTLRKQGSSKFFAALIKCLNAFLFSEKFIITPKKIFFCDPSFIIHEAEKRFLINIEYFPHRELDSSGGVVSSKTRFDYIFKKII